MLRWKSKDLHTILSDNFKDFPVRAMYICSSPFIFERLAMDRSLTKMRHVVRIIFAVLEFGIVKTKCLYQGRRFDAPIAAVAF